MRRLLVRLMVALLTFTIGISTASLWLILRRPFPTGLIPIAELPTSPTPAQPERKCVEVDGRGMPKDGASVAVSAWCTSDGMRFSRTSEYHTSPERADRALRKALIRAVEIIKREPLFDGAGLKVGEKVIATFPSKYPEDGAASLLWTHRSAFRYVTSSSLENILAYEKEFNGQSH